jgi:hypothetical protein
MDLQSWLPGTLKDKITFTGAATAALPLSPSAFRSTYKGSGKVFVHTSGTGVLFDAVCQMRIFSPSDSSGLPLLVMI